MERLSEKICNKNECHEAKLVSIFPMNFFLKRKNLFPAFPAFWGQVYSGEKLKVLYQFV